MRSRFLLGLLILALAPRAHAAGQKTWYVDAAANPPGGGTPNAPFASLQYAVSHAAVKGGDILLVGPGTYVERVDFGGKALLVRSVAGAELTVIDAGPLPGTGAVVRIASGEAPGTLLEGFTLRHGSGIDLGEGARGGGLYIADSHARVRGCILTDNTASAGGGAYIEGAVVQIEATRFVLNTVAAEPAACSGGEPATFGAGLLACAGSSLFLVDVDFDQNAGSDCGGGALAVLDSELYWKGGGARANAVVELACPVGGAGLYARGSFCQVQGVLFEENTASGVLNTHGGGLRWIDSSGRLTKCTLARNRAGEAAGAFADNPGWGGGASAPTGTLAIEGCTFSENIAWSGGGGLDAGAGVQVYDSSFGANRGQFGGGVHGGGHYERCTFEENVATSLSGAGHFGGAAYGAMTMLRCTIRQNISLGDAGGVRALRLEQCTLQGNIAAGDPWGNLASGGGALDTQLVSCRVFNNIAAGFGGGLAGGSATLCDVYGNLAIGYGGGAHAAALERSTLWGNTAAEGSTGFSGPPPQGGGATACSVTSSILAANVPDQVGLPLVPLFGASQVTFSTVTGGWPGVGNQDADPLLWHPAAGDFFLQPSSPCIDAGAPGSLDPDGSPLDQGAHPFAADHCPKAVTYCTAKLNSLGCLPSIQAHGPLVSDESAPLLVRALVVPSSKNGFFFYGTNGRAAVPFLGGTLCMNPPFRRTPLSNSGGPAFPVDCTGVLAFDFGAWVASGLATELVPGLATQGQFWYRDPPDPTGSGLTDAIEVVYCH